MNARAAIENAGIGGNAMNDMQRLNIELELRALDAEFEGMRQENQARINDCGIDHCHRSFLKLAERYRALKVAEPPCALDFAEIAESRRKEVEERKAKGKKEPLLPPIEILRDKASDLTRKRPIKFRGPDKDQA